MTEFERQQLALLREQTAAANSTSGCMKWGGCLIAGVIALTILGFLGAML